MGTDIHLTLERRRLRSSFDPIYLAEREEHDPGWEPEWEPMAYAHTDATSYAATFRIDRDYYFFCLLCGVRAHRFDRDYALYPARGLPENISHDTSELCARWGRDAHTHSWLTLVELRHVVTVFGETDIEVLKSFHFAPDADPALPEEWSQAAPSATWNYTSADGWHHRLGVQKKPRNKVEPWTCETLYDAGALVAMMEVMEQAGNETRAIFFFDN